MPPRRRTSPSPTSSEPTTPAPTPPAETAPPAPARARKAAATAAAPTAPPAPPEPLRPASVGRYPVEDLEPVVAHGTRPVKAVVGERFVVRATVFREGHDSVGATVVLRAPDGTETRSPMRHLAQDRYEAVVVCGSVGYWSYAVEAWGDPVGTWHHRAEIKVPAGIDVELELEEGAQVLERAMAGMPRGKAREPLKVAVAALRDRSRPAPARLAVADDPVVVKALHETPLRDHVTSSMQVPVLVERERALYGAWYEFFPRSEGATLDPPRSGTFRTAAERLPAVAEMGFDVLYLPPIHPIGFTNRKGRNNTLDPGPDDPGVPWGIGSAAGGHDAIHPDLGTFDDFRYFVGRATELGIEIALDFALQCSPDHPWVTEHPNWFAHRADGTIAYAENPPKKYQDIYPVYFDDDFDGIVAECDRVLRLWMAEGVRIFRVDNPHTKPVHFWERLFGGIHATDPDVIFLAEAFTKAPMMKILGEVGFQQSYTYFTWRNEKWELEEYFRELSGPLAASMRPNCFVNTPDILPEFLQYGGPPAFAIRATLAATLAPTWGVYAGFELFEHVALAPGREEYLDSEKYEYKPRDWAAADASGNTLAPYIGQLNGLRRAHPSLHRLRNLRFHRTNNDKVIAYSKREGDDVVLVVCTLDPYGVREAVLDLDMPSLGLSWSDQFAARDLINGATYVWGQYPFVRLDPHVQVAHVIHVRAGAV